MSMAPSFDSKSLRSDRYDQLELQCPALLSDEDVVANQANLTAILKEAFGWHWVGFYRVHKEELVLGPFQGPVACTRLSKGRGVCAKAWETNSAVLVPDVDVFPGHVACSPLSRSELVVPVRDPEGRVQAVLDLDSAELNGFEEEDAIRIQRLVDQHANRLYTPTHG